MGVGCWGRLGFQNESVWFSCYRANMAHVRQSKPDYGLGFQVKVLKILQADFLRSEADLENEDLLGLLGALLPLELQVLLPNQAILKKCSTHSHTIVNTCSKLLTTFSTHSPNVHFLNTFSKHPHNILNTFSKHSQNNHKHQPVSSYHQNILRTLSG